MKYTVAIPSHNRKDGIERCVHSALALDFDDYEIVVSDTSDEEDIYDNICKIDDPKLRVFHNDSKWSMWENHNFLLKEARGKYILIIHSDDYLYNHALKAFDQKLRDLEYPRRVFLAGESIYRSWGDRMRALSVKDEIVCGSLGLELFMAGLTPSGTLFSSDITSMGGFIHVPMIMPHSDMITELYLILNGYKFIFLNDIVFHRDANGTVLREGSDEERKAFLDEMKLRFSTSELNNIASIAAKQYSPSLLSILSLDSELASVIDRSIIKYTFRGFNRIWQLNRHINNRIRRIIKKRS